MNKSLVRAYEFLADLESEKGNLEKRDEYLNVVINELEAEYNHEQSQAKKAHILGLIADVHTRQGKFQESLPLFEHVVKIYEESNDIGGFAKATLIVAEHNMRLGNRESAFENWQKVSDLVKGTAFHEFASIAKINSGSYLIRTGDYEAAQRYLEEAHYLISKYRLRHSSEVDNLLKEIKDKRAITNPPEKTFSYMVNRLYDGISKTPEAIEPLLRHWYTKYEKELFQHFYNLFGLKCVLYSDNINKIHSLSSTLDWLLDYFFIASNETFKQNSYDLVMYPYENFEAGEHFAFIARKNDSDEEIGKQPLTQEEQILSTLNKPNEDGKLPKYIFMPTQFDDEVKVVLVGWGKGLPSIAYEFVKKHNADEIIKGNKFVLGLDRFASRDKLFSDVLFCWQLSSFPIYLSDELKSEDVSILTKVTVEVPNSYSGDKIKITSTKKLFNSLFKATRENAKTVLNDFKYEMELLFGQETDRTTMTISLVEIKYFVKKIVYPLIILNEK